MIVNPASGSGRTGRRWPEIARRAAAHGLEVEPRLDEFRVGVCTRRKRLAAPLIRAFWDSLDVR